MKLCHRSQRGLPVRATLLLALAATLLPASAQAPQAVRSPEVHPDRRVTFRLRAPNAKEVTLSREGAPGQPMWSGFAASGIVAKRDIELTSSV